VIEQEIRSEGAGSVRGGFFVRSWEWFIPKGTISSILRPRGTSPGTIVRKAWDERGPRDLLDRGQERVGRSRGSLHDIIEGEVFSPGPVEKKHGPIRDIRDGVQPPSGDDLTLSL